MKISFLEISSGGNIFPGNILDVSVEKMTCVPQNVQSNDLSCQKTFPGEMFPGTPPKKFLSEVPYIGVLIYFKCLSLIIELFMAID